jgi:hypothetical protein
LIWNLASRPRVLTICKHFSHDEDTQYLYSTDPVPATLQVCQESRFKSPYTASFTVGNNPHYIWVNFDLDTIRIHDYAIRHIKLADKLQISQAIVEADSCTEFQFWEIHDMCELVNLKEVTILSVSALAVWLDEFDTMFFWLRHNTPSHWLGWVRPMIRIIERSTGEEVNSMNLSERSSKLLQRIEWEDKYGYGPDINNDEAADREERRVLEAEQRMGVQSRLWGFPLM